MKADVIKSKDGQSTTWSQVYLKHVYTCTQKYTVDFLAFSVTNMILEISSTSIRTVICVCVVCKCLFKTSIAITCESNRIHVLTHMIQTLVLLWYVLTMYCKRRTHNNVSTVKNVNGVLIINTRIFAKLNNFISSKNKTESN